MAASCARPVGQLRRVGNQRGRAADGGPFARGTRPDTTVQLSRPTISPADDRGSYFICSLGISGRGLAPGEQQHKMTGSWPRHDLLPELRPLGPGSGLRGPALHSDSDERPLRSGRPGVVGPRSPWPCVFLGRKADRNVCLLSAQFHRY